MKNDKNSKKKNNQNNNMFLYVVIAIVIISVFLLPFLYDYIEKSKLPKVSDDLNNVDYDKDKEEDKVIDEDVLEIIHYPKMRSSMYSTNTYYSLDTFTVNDLSNKDILLNAFLAIQDVSANIKKYDGYASCTTNPKQFSDEIMSLRIKNVLNKNLTYTLEDFYVPEDSLSKYVGDWTYDKNKRIFIYKGLCRTGKTSTTYHDLEQQIKIEYQNDDIVAYYYVGFAKVLNNQYTIYSDALMQNEIGSGTLNNIDELNDIFKSIDNNNKRVYKYTFKDTLCTYNEYCLYKGEWTNEL